MADSPRETAQLLLEPWRSVKLTRVTLRFIDPESLPIPFQVVGFSVRWWVNLSEQKWVNSGERYRLEWSKGDRTALDRLMPLVYEELRQLARRYMAAEPSGHTLQTTALIHEAYLRLIDQKEAPQNRAHFFAIAAQSMRRILLDRARTRHAAKRGGVSPKTSLEEAELPSQEQAEELVALDQALRALEAVDPRKSQVVELRYFGGLSVDEAAEVLGVAPITVMRDWKLAKAWILRELSEAHG